MSGLLPATRVRDFGCGELLTIASEGVVSLHRYVRDGERTSRDVEHAYPSHSLVFTDAGEWRYHGSDGRATIDARSIVAGTGLCHYACAHPRGVPNECFVVAVSNEALEDEADALFVKTVAGVTPEMLALRRAIVRASDEPDRLEGLAFSLFDAVARATASSKGERSADVRMAYAKRLMAEACRRPVTVAEIARELHLSRFTFTRRFLARAGTTPHAFMTDVRIARAKELLRTTTLPVEEIALANGFGSIAHFSSAFRRLASMTPTTFRRLSER